MKRSLTVYLHGVPVGALEIVDPQHLSLQYRAEWLAHPKAIPLSLSLPVQRDMIIGPQVNAFFANLLPEAEVRRDICRQLGISARNDAALLAAIGGDCAGAITMLPADMSLPKVARYRTISDKQLDTAIATMSKNPLLTAQENLRLSLAGARQKLPVRYTQGTFAVPLGAAASSHIIKPDDPHWPNLVMNEYFCMELARACGLPVPAVELWRGPKNRALIVERYDRIVHSSGKIERIHQEDFCQALGIHPEQKYENEGGPTLAQCFQLIEQYQTEPLPIIAKEQLLLWIIFNVLIGNADAHGKNLSLLHSHDRITLAPFYDLVSTTVYPQVSTKLAMKIGKRYERDAVSVREWERVAVVAGVRPARIFAMMTQMAQLVPLQADLTRRLMKAAGHDDPILAKIQTIIHHGCQLLARAIR